MRRSLLITALALSLTGAAAVPAGARVGATFHAGFFSEEPAPHSRSLVSPQRSGGISEMAASGKQGVRGDRAQFVRAITRLGENRAFLSQLPH